MTEKTAGQQAYEAREGARGRRMGAPSDRPDAEITAIISFPWESLPPGQQADEEAAATAVETEQVRLARLELLQARGEAAETAAELVRVKQLHAGLLGEVRPNGGGYTFRTTGVLLARRYAAANLPLRDDLSHLAGQ